MKWIPRNWKTALAGVALLLTTLSKVAADPNVIMEHPSDIVAQIGAGIGLIAAKDHNK